MSKVQYEVEYNWEGVWTRIFFNEDEARSFFNLMKKSKKRCGLYRIEFDSSGDRSMITIDEY